jgi:aryl-alcohol dehydrogenase-like predicted oxidoreductase
VVSIARNRLGSPELQASRLSLGSWRTFERISREDALAVMRAAREHGFNFLDDARYDDETGTAPIPTGYSEVLFGELFRAAGWNREDTVVSNKLWWEFWPQQSAAAELDGSLARMGFDHVDLIYANPPPDDLPLPEMVAAVSELGTTPAALAVAFALANPAVTSVLLGATSPAQIEQNVAALELDPRVVLQALEV